MAKDVKREQLILDRGYHAVRSMAKEMVANGATLADILFHANQVWHEFKTGAMQLPGVIDSGLYIDRYDAEASDRIIRASERYKTGTDSVRVAQYVGQIEASTGKRP